MEQQETSPAIPTTTTRSVGIRYGLIGGVISIIYFLVLNVAGINMTSGYWSWVGYLITIAILTLAHKYFKEESDGFMSYGQGMGIAFWMGLISAAISSVFTYIYVKFIDNSFMQMIKDKQMEDMEARGMSDEQIEQAMKFASMFSTPEALLIMGLIFGVIGTVIVGLIVTIFTQKKAPEQAF
jgi:hypothetical protein